MNARPPFDVAQAEENIRAFESSTGYELIVAAVPTSDPYPGAAWRGGLLLGTLLAGLWLHFYELNPRAWEALVVAGCVAAATYLLRLTGFHHAFLWQAEADRESAEKAATLFSRFQGGGMGHQASILLFFSLGDHRIHLLVDRELAQKLPQADLDEIVEALGTPFRRRDYGAGIALSVDLLERKILNKVGKRPESAPDQVANRVFWLG